jgi:hypothetical protein
MKRVLFCGAIYRRRDSQPKQTQRDALDGFDPFYETNVRALETQTDLHSAKAKARQNVDYSTA